jgi:hypothetical protein
MEALIEGMEYSFRVEKLISLPDADYFILMDEWGNKYLLPEVYYKNYQIKPGKNILCSVNKINCNGKIFLEPRHPIYTIGMIDSFEIYAIEQRIKHKSNETYSVALAKNEKTDKAAVINCTDMSSLQLPTNKVCIVVKLKKAEVLLEFIKK